MVLPELSDPFVIGQGFLLAFVEFFKGTYGKQVGGAEHAMVQRGEVDVQHFGMGLLRGNACQIPAELDDFKILVIGKRIRSCVQQRIEVEVIVDEQRCGAELGHLAFEQFHELIDRDALRLRHLGRERALARSEKVTEGQ